MIFALVGNQNSGKSSIFNNITNQNQHVGNFPGVTVDLSIGKIEGNEKYKIVDLPGLYSLSTYSDDENVTKEFLYNKKPDAIINVIDSINLRRSLYLSLQLKEIGIPMIIVLNMINEVQTNKGTIDITKLENLLEVPIIPVTTITKDEVKSIITKTKQIAKRKTALSEIKNNVKEKYSKIDFICSQVFNVNKNKRKTNSERIDKLLTSKIFGIPIFVLIMYVIFKLTFDIIGNPISDLLIEMIDKFSIIIENCLNKIECNQIIQSLIIDGILKGVGAVLSFLPIVIILYFLLSILEDSGYMTRIVFIMDKILQNIGLSGRSIVPILLGFGCSVPAILSTRTIESKKEKNLVINLISFINCSAKIPIYIAFVKIFFSKNQALAMLIIYFLDLLLGIIIITIIKIKTKQETEDLFLLELPNYRMPSLKNTYYQMKNKTEEFIEKAFTVIFFTSITIWFLKNFDFNLNIVNEEQSILSKISQSILPIFKLIGIENWRIISAIITGISAKESILSTMTILSNQSLEQFIINNFNFASSISFITFISLYTPCIATIGTIKKEFGIKKAIEIGINQFAIAYFLSFLIFNILA